MAIRKTAAEHETKLYRSISEVGEMLDVKPHVLRYWETQFSMLRPTKNRAGNRMYRPDEVKMLLRIKELLYARRYTIEGARRTLLGERREESPQVELGFDHAERQMLMIEVKEGLRDIVARLRARPDAPRRDSEPTPVG